MNLLKTYRMRDVHTIRLRGPWQIQPVARYVDRGDGTWDIISEDLPAPSRAKLPADWTETLGARFYGQVKCTRRFHKPSGLEDREEVWLVIDPPCSHASIDLNERALGEARSDGPSARIEVTRLLEEVNELRVTVSHPELDSSRRPTHDFDAGAVGGLVGEARLEIGFP